MSQKRVTTFYHTRKHATVTRIPKLASVDPKSELKANLMNCCLNPSASSPEKVRKIELAPKVTNVEKPKVRSKPSVSKRSQKPAKTKQKTADIRSAFEAQSSKQEEKKKEITLNTTYTISDNETTPKAENVVPRSPKRSLIKAPSSASKKQKQDHDFGKPGTKETKVQDRNTVRRKLVLTEDTSKASNSQITEIQVGQLSTGKSEELREKLLKFEKTFQKLSNFQSNKCKITSVIVPPEKKKDFVEKDVAAEVKPPAYERFASLCFRGEPRLFLPNKYCILMDTFQHSDAIVSMLFNRKETCTFGKLKSGVENVMRKTFNETHLGQIKSVYPTSYDVSIEKTSTAVINRNPGTPLYQLVVIPDLKDLLLEESPRGMKSPLNNTDSNASSKKKTVTSPSKYRNGTKMEVSMTPAALVTRKKLFSEKLLEIVHKHHQAFLASFKPPVHIPANKLTQWHPKFNLDQIPDVVPAALPILPDQQKADSAKDVLEKIRGIHPGGRLEKALDNVVKKNEAAPKPAESVKNDKVKSGILKGLSLSILQKVRAREAAKIADDMIRNPKDLKRCEMLERIPEFVRILRTYFITERKAAVPLDDAMKKLADSYHTSISCDEVEKHLRLMAEVFPKWLFMVPVRHSMYLKINKNMDVNVLIDNMPKQ